MSGLVVPVSVSPDVVAAIVAEMKSQGLVVPEERLPGCGRWR